MKIINDTNIIELEVTKEIKGDIFYSLPFVAERKETSEQIIWYGYSSNWIYSKKDTHWQNDIGQLTDEPEYEKIYRNLIKKKKIK